MNTDNKIRTEIDNEKAKDVNGGIPRYVLGHTDFKAGITNAKVQIEGVHHGYRIAGVAAELVAAPKAHHESRDIVDD